MIGLQIPAGPILVDAEPMLRPQMPTQGLGAKPAFETHDVIGVHRSPDRHSWLARLRWRRGGLSQSSERAMNRDDQFDKLVGSELMRPHVAADDARDLIEIDLRRRVLLGHVCAP